MASGVKNLGFLILFEGRQKKAKRGSKRAPRGPKFPLPREAPQEAPRGPPRGPQEAPKRPPRGLKRLQEAPPGLLYGDGGMRGALRIIMLIMPIIIIMVT